METSLSNIKCELCHKSFSQISSRNRHVREQHTKPGLYQCKECGSRFSKKFNLQIHLKQSHTKNTKTKGKQNKCSQCPEVFPNILTLKKHTQRQHSNDTTLEGSYQETSAQALAKTVLKELKQLQQEIESAKEHFSILPEFTDIEKSIVRDITIKDNLYPLGHFTLIKIKAIKRGNKQTFLICEFCSKEFRKTYNLLRHRRTHTKVRPFICVLCKKSFATANHLKTHCSIHKLNEDLGLFHRLYKCPKCNEGFSSILQIDKHLRSSESCRHICFKCPKCFRFFRTFRRLMSHKHLENDNELDILKTILPTPLVKTENNGEMTLYECNLCGLQMQSKIMLVLHEKRHSNLYKYQCTECHHSYNTQTALKIHTKSHIQQGIFKCQYCTKTFTTVQNCRQHMMRHLKKLIKTQEASKENNDILCKYPTFIDNKETSETVIIKPSKQIKIANEKSLSDFKYKCPKCDKSFRFNAWLKKHFKYKHISDLSFECNQCSKTFCTKQILKDHLITHSPQRMKFTCQVCGRQYASTKSLKLHLRIHTQEKPFKCDECFKNFRTSGHLKQHKTSIHRK